MNILPAISPNATDAADLDALANEMLAEATSADSERILSASGFARENISIVHQQIRCANLAWALNRTKRVSQGDVVGIVGGSFSGLMLAVSLALTSGAIVYIFEKDPRLLSRFRQKAHRHLSPVLNSRFLGKGFDAATATPEFIRPIFAWTKGPASEVAHQWLNEFRRFDRQLPIFTFAGHEVLAENIIETPNGMTIGWSDRPHLERVRVGLLIDATGFGEENNRHALKDYSYWDGGHRLTYDHLSTPATVLVSGCGDSGVIEAFHYAVSDFQHEEVEALWPQFRNLESVLDQGVASARLFDIFHREDAESYGVISEICWWHFIRSNLVRNPHHDWLGDGDHIRPLFLAIDAHLRPLAEAWACRTIEAIGDDLEDFIETVSKEVQQQVRSAVRPLAEHWISLRLQAFADTLDTPSNHDTLRSLERLGVRVVLNGLTPTPYTRQLSPYNVWLMRLLTSLPSVSYRQGEITEVKSRGRRNRVDFDRGCSMMVDRVVTRYGAGPGAGGGLAIGASRDDAVGDYLLNQPSYVSTPAGGGHARRIHPVRQSIRDGVDALNGASAPGSWDISKRRYVQRMLLGANGFPEDDDFHKDPELRLSEELKRGRRPTFKIDDMYDEAMKV